MKVIIYSNLKGGAGKTTALLHTAVELERQGRGPVAVLDFDEEQWLTRWWKQRDAATPEHRECANPAGLPAVLKELRGKGYAWAFIDTPAGHDELHAALMKHADLVLIPMQPAPFDIMGGADTVPMCEAAGKPYCFVLTRAVPRSTSLAVASAQLSKYGEVCPAFLGDRELFKNCLASGGAAMEYQNRSVAAQEVRGLVAFLLEQFPDTRKTPKEKRHA